MREEFKKFRENVNKVTPNRIHRFISQCMFHSSEIIYCYLVNREPRRLTMNTASYLRPTNIFQELFECEESDVRSKGPRIFRIIRKIVTLTRGQPYHEQPEHPLHRVFSFQVTGYSCTSKRGARPSRKRDRCRRWWRRTGRPWSRSSRIAAS